MLIKTIILTLIAFYSFGSFAPSDNKYSNGETIFTLTVPTTVTDSIISKNTKSLLHRGLSNKFDFQTKIQRFPTEYFDSCIVKISVIEKQTKKSTFQTQITSTELFDSSFMTHNVRSYITGENKDAEVSDNNFGEIVVADFNFDNREDFAVKRAEGGNSGPNYNFYIQSNNSDFYLDEFLSYSVIYFPSEFNNKKKTITTFVARVFGVRKVTYRYDSEKRNWKRIKDQLIKWD